MIRSAIWHYPHLKFMMGGTTFIYEVISEFRSKDIGTTLIIQNGDKSIISAFQKVCRNLYITSRITTNNLIYWALFPFILTIEILKTFRIVRNDLSATLIATHFPSNAILAVVAMMTRRSFYYYCYEPFPFFHNPSFIATYPLSRRCLLLLLSIVYGWVDVWAVRRAEVVFTLNTTTRKMIKKVYGVDSVITLMGVNSSLFKPRQIGKFSKDYEGKKIIVHSTDYTKMKNTNLAIEIFYEMKKVDHNIIMLITSTQPDSELLALYTSQVEQMNLTESVKFLGLLSSEELAQLYSDAWLYISTSSDEMLGTTSSNLPVKQALASGTPVIRAKVQGADDVEDGISGYFINPHDSRGSSRKALKCIKNLRINKKMGMAGRKRIVASYSWHLTSERMLKGINDQIN